MQLKYFKNLIDFCRIDKPFDATGLSLYRLIFSGSTERDPAAWTELKIHPMKYVWKHIKLSNELSNNLITLATMNPVSLKLTISKRSHRGCSLKKKTILKKFAKFAGKHQCWSHTFFTAHLRVTAFEFHLGTVMWEKNITPSARLSI